MARNVVRKYVKPKRKSHPHSKNASAGKTGYKKKYRGQGRWEKYLYQVNQVQEEAEEVVCAKIIPIM